MTKNELADMMAEDLFGSMDTAYKRLCVILHPVNHKPLKWSDAARFVQDKKFAAAMNEIKTIVNAHVYLRQNKLQEDKNNGRSKK